MSRKDRVAQFCRQAGGGWFDTSLRRVGEHRPSDDSRGKVCWVATVTFSDEATRRAFSARCIAELIEYDPTIFDDEAAA